MRTQVGEHSPWVLFFSPITYNLVITFSSYQYVYILFSKHYLPGSHPYTASECGRSHKGGKRHGKSTGLTH